MQLVNCKYLTIGEQGQIFKNLKSTVKGIHEKRAAVLATLILFEVYNFTMDDLLSLKEITANSTKY